MSTKKGEGKENISVKIAYLESDFVCSCPIIAGDLSGSIQAAAAHGVKEAAKELCLSKKLLHARPIGPLEKEDGSPFSVEEWTKQYMVVVEAEPAGGLIARCKTQDALISQLMAQGVEDISMSAGKVNLDNDLKQENDVLKEENAALKLRVFNLQEEYQKLTQVNQLPLNVSKLEEERFSALSLVGVRKAEKETLEVENKGLKERVAVLEREVQILKEEVASVKKECADLKKEMSKLNGWERVLIRKMLDKCRQKCKEILVASNMQAPASWNMACQDPALVAVLQANGLSIGLTSTMYGANTPQHQGSRAAHDITEGIDIYASAVCKMTGARRARFLNVFEFVFGVSAETIEFEDDLDDM